MEVSVAFLFFVFGTIIGSFLNVVILRYNTGATLFGRSHCFSCQAQIKWYDLFPLFSYLALRGKCRHCRSSLSAQYVIVEFLTGLLFLAVGMNATYVGFLDEFTWVGGFFILSEITVMSLVVVIGAYDLRHQIIPDFFVGVLAIATFVHMVVSTPFESMTTLASVLALFSAPLIALPLFLLWLFSKGRWIGLGDAKLVWSFGWFLGFVGGISAVVVGFWVGAVVSLFLMGCVKVLPHVKHVVPLTLRRRFPKLTMQSEVPFAPFLLIGFLIVYFSGVDVLNIGSLITLLSS